MSRNAKNVEELKKEYRMYSRERGGETRWYQDLRKLGGGREALKPEGENGATSDLAQAVVLAAERLDEIKNADTDAKRRKVLLKKKHNPATIKAFAAHHLRLKARSNRFTTGWLETTYDRLRHAIGFFGPQRDLASIDKDDMQGYANHLQGVPNGRGGTISPGTQRHYLNVLSNLYRRAQGSVVPSGYNPVSDLMDKPSGDPGEADWLENSDAALLLESARTIRLDPDAHSVPTYPLIATYLLTGGRMNAVLGLEVDDISLQRKTVTFRPNQWRRLKTKNSLRTVKLWPQLEEILREYFIQAEASGGLGRLVFPSSRYGEERKVTDFRKSLDAVAARCGWKKGEIRTKMFRHTYCAARLQTFSWVKTGENQDGEPILSPIPPSNFQVGKELGHGGARLVDNIYGHLGDIPHRSEFVEFRIEQHREALGEKLVALEVASV